MDIKKRGNQAMASKLELHKVGMYWFMISAICTLSFCINIIAGIVSLFVVLVPALIYFIKNYEDEFTCFACKQFLTQAVSPLNNQGLKPAVHGSDFDTLTFGVKSESSDSTASQELIEEKSPIGNQQRRSSLGGANGATLSFGVPMYSGASHCSTQSESSDDYSEVSSLDGDSAILQKRMADLQNQSCYSGDDTSDWDKLDYSIKTVSEGTESEISSLASEEAHSSKEFKDCDASIDDRSINIKFLGDFFKRAFGNTASAPAPEAMVDDASSELPVASKKAFSGVFNCGRLGQLRAREGDSDFPGNSFSS